MRRNHSPPTLVIKFNRSHVISAELPRRNYYCLFATRSYRVFLRAHSVRGEPRISAQRQPRGCNIITRKFAGVHRAHKNVPH